MPRILLAPFKRLRRFFRKFGRNFLIPRRGPFSVLPPELLALIFNHLVNDKTSLASCCLVTRGWTGWAQAQLFCSISIVLRSDRNSQCDLDTTLSKFSTFLQHSPHVRGYIKILGLRSDLRIPALTPPVRMWLDKTSDFVSVLQQLPALHTVSFQWIRIDTPSSPFTWAPSQPLKSLQSLILRQTRTEDGSFQVLMNMFDIQDTLHLYMLKDDVDEDEEDTGSGPQLSSFSARKLFLCIPEGHEGEHLLELLVETRFPNLTALYINPTWSRNIPGALHKLNRFLSLNGSHLQSIRTEATVPYNNTPQAPLVPPSFDRVCPNLTMLHLIFTIKVTSDTSRFGQAAVVPQAVSDLIVQSVSSAPRKLANIIFDVTSTTIYSDDFDDEIDGHTVGFWGDIRKALHSLPYLRSVRFVGHRLSWDFDDVVEVPLVPLSLEEQHLIASHLLDDDLRARGIIHWE